MTIRDDASALAGALQEVGIEVEDIGKGVGGAMILFLTGEDWVCINSGHIAACKGSSMAWMMPRGKRSLRQTAMVLAISLTPTPRRTG